jgi:uncharacterized protein (DUF302 family)
MSYYFNKVLKNQSFDAVIEKVTEIFKNQGFGVLSDIDVKATLKMKIDVDFRNYRILGACNPTFAHKALIAEPHIGVFLPCNVIVQENQNGDIEVSAVDPMASMMSVGNDSLGGIAEEVQSKMKKVIEDLT